MAEEFSKNGDKRTIKDDVRQYIEKRIQLLTLNITEQVSLVLAESFQRMLGMFILSFALFFFWFAVGFFLGELIGNMSAGFAIASIPLFIIGFVLMNRKSKRVTEKVQAQLMGKVLDNLGNEEELEKIKEEKIEQH